MWDVYWKKLQFLAEINWIKLGGIGLPLLHDSIHDK